MPDLLLEIRVRPNASHNKVGGTAGDPPRLVVAVQAPAVDGKANAAVIVYHGLHEFTKLSNLTVRFHNTLACSKILHAAKIASPQACTL